MRMLATLAVLVALCPCARADELERTGFGLRFTAGLSRFSRYPDSAGIGGAGGGSPWSSSPNPASSGMNPSVGPSRHGLSVQVAHVAFDEGQKIDVLSASGAYEDPRWGSWQPSVFRLASNRATRRDGLEFSWEGQGVELQWARKLTDDTAFGVNLSVFRSKIRFDLGSLAVSESTSTTYGIRAGALRRLSERFYAGVALELTGAPGRTTLHDIMGTGAGDTRERDTTWSLTARPGIYTFLTDDLTAYVDYQFARFWDGSGRLDVHRLYAGLDLTVREGVYVRAGTIVDHFGHVAFTAGLGIAPHETFFLDLAWQYDMFPELEQDFGAAHVFSLGATLLL